MERYGLSMKNSFMSFRCRKCAGNVTVWTRLPPTERHAYRVTCGACGVFGGWGTEPQLSQLRQARRVFKMGVSVVEPPPATLKDLF
jgi:ribosomal protein S27E